MSLRILHVVEAFGGGVFEMTRIIAERSASSGHTVAIAYGRRPETPADVRSAVDGRVDMFATPWTQRTALAQVRAARAIDRIVREWQPDVIHLQSSFAGVLGALVLARHRIPMVYTPHGYAFGMSSASGARRLIFRWLERLAARRVGMVGAISANEADAARRVAGARRVRIIENGIPELDPESIPPPSSSASAAVVAVGRLRPQRRPQACARMLGALRDVASVEWIGGGDREDEDWKALGAAGVPVTGWLSRDETLARVGKATVYLHWTAWDGLPLSVLEAMARDVVVVASDIPANREVLGPEVVFDDERQAVEFVRRVLSDAPLRERLIAAQQMRRRHYSANRMVTEWSRLYADLATDGAAT